MEEARKSEKRTNLLRPLLIGATILCGLFTVVTLGIIHFANKV